MMWYRKIHKTGDIRIIEKFAWLPVNLADDRVVWLEPYWVKQIWKPKRDLFGNYGGWKTISKKRYKDHLL